MADAFPLQWPEGWERTALLARRRSAYKVTPSRAYGDMIDSLVMLGADRRSIVVSSNLRPLSNGQPRLDQPRPEDPGVAVYWVDLKLGERVIACDKYEKPHENMRAIGLAIEGLRAMQRAGATQIMERAFSAFGALPASSAVPEKRPWWAVMDLSESFVSHLSIGMVDARYRELSKKLHPDNIATGSREAMAELNQAMADARAHFGEVS